MLQCFVLVWFECWAYFLQWNVNFLLCGVKWSPSGSLHLCPWPLGSAVSLMHPASPVVSEMGRNPLIFFPEGTPVWSRWSLLCCQLGSFPSLSPSGECSDWCSVPDVHAGSAGTTFPVQYLPSRSHCDHALDKLCFPLPKLSLHSPYTWYGSFTLHLSTSAQCDEWSLPYSSLPTANSLTAVQLNSVRLAYLEIMGAHLWSSCISE